MHIVGDDEVMRPIDDLLVRLVRRLGTERWIADQTLEHDRAQRPPIALVSVSLLQENLGRDIIGRPDGRICLGRDQDPILDEQSEKDALTSFLRFAFQVAIWSLLDMVRCIALTITLFLADCAAVVGDVTPFAESKSRW